MKQITIQIPDTDPDKCGIQISPEITCTEAFQMVGTLALHILNAYTKVATSTLQINHNSGDTPKESKLSKSELKAATQGIQESMFDAMDSVFSTVLQNYYPDAPKLSLEEEAILELTNKKIEERYNQLTPEEQSAYSKAYTALRENLRTKALQSSHLPGDNSDETTNESDTSETDK